MKNISDSVNPTLNHASRESNRLKKLVSQCLPVELCSQLLFLRVAAQKLHITTSSSAWAARLRFSAPELLAVLNRDGIAANGVSVHVLPENSQLTATVRQSQRTKPNASQRTIDTINQVAEAVIVDQETENDSLQTALQRLARNLEK